jgi:hypothetical protein
MGGLESFIRMKPKPIPKELINKIELRVEDFEITPRERYGFEGYLLKDVLVPYIENKRRGGVHFNLKARKNTENVFEIRYQITLANSHYYLNRIAYIMLNKDDPRVVETENHYDIADNLKVDHDKDIELQDRKFIIKADREKNLKLLTNAENTNKSVKKMNDLPKYIHFSSPRCCWCFEVHKSITNAKPKTQTFAIIKNGWEGAFIKAIDRYNQYTGDNYIPNLDNAIPDEFKGMTEREFYEKYSWKFNNRRKINPNNQLDLGLSLA